MMGSREEAQVHWQAVNGGKPDGSWERDEKCQKDGENYTPRGISTTRRKGPLPLVCDGHP